MTGLIGADVEDLERLAAQLRHAADRLEAIRGQITSTYGRTQWEGEDADHCRNEWHYRLAPLLHSAANAGRGAATVLDRNVVEQRTASGVIGVVGGGIGGFLGTRLGGPGDHAGGGHGDDHGEHHHNPWHYIHMAAEAVVIPLEILHESGLLRVGHTAIQVAHGAVAAFGLGLAVGELVYGLATDPGAPTTYQAGINTVFGAAALATMAFPPLSLAITGVGLAYNVAEMIWPGIGKTAIEGAAHGISVAGDWLVDTGGDIVEAGVDMVTDVVEGVGDVVEGVGDAVGNVISGGVNAFVSIFG